MSPVRILCHAPPIFLLIMNCGTLMAAGVPGAPTTGAQQLKRFGDQYCFSCHGAKRQKGDFNFETHAAKANVLSDRKAWEKIAEMLESREMPPKGKPHPPE